MVSSWRPWTREEYERWQQGVIEKNEEERRVAAAQKSVAEENRRIWALFYPDTLEFYERDPVEIDPNEDWDTDWHLMRSVQGVKPLPLREGDSLVREMPTSDFGAAVVHPAPAIKCADETGDDVDPFWCKADDERAEPVKVTDALLVAWHRRGYR